MKHLNELALWDYIEGSASPAQQQIWNAHLHHCMQCQEALNGVRVLHTALQNLAPEQTSPNFERKVLAQWQTVSKEAILVEPILSKSFQWILGLLFTLVFVGPIIYAMSGGFTNVALASNATILWFQSFMTTIVQPTYFILSHPLVLWGAVLVYAFMFLGAMDKYLLQPLLHKKMVRTAK